MSNYKTEQYYTTTHRTVGIGYDECVNTLLINKTLHVHTVLRQFWHAARQGRHHKMLRQKLVQQWLKLLYCCWQRRSCIVINIVQFVFIFLSWTFGISVLIQWMCHIITKVATGNGTRIFCNHAATAWIVRSSTADPFIIHHSLSLLSFSICYLFVLPYATFEHQPCWTG